MKAQFPQLTSNILAAHKLLLMIPTVHLKHTQKYSTKPFSAHAEFNTKKSAFLLPLTQLLVSNAL